MDKPLALIIEDDFDLSEIFSAALQRGEFETEVVRDGKAAMERIKGTPPAIVILDLNLPYVDGTTILKEIKATESFSKTSVIVTTADAQQADRLRGIADLVLLKPVSVDQLHELAKRLLRRWHQNP
jgi:two-component system response regulator BaeR